MITRAGRLGRSSTSSCRASMDRLFGDHARIPEDRAEAMAGHAGRARRDRRRGAPRPADRCGGQTIAARRQRRAGHRRRLHRLDAFDRDAARDHREACRMAPSCCRGSISISTTQSWNAIGGGRTRTGSGPSAILHAGAAAAASRSTREAVTELGAPRAAWPRSLAVGGAAAGRHDRSLARRG